MKNFTRVLAIALLVPMISGCGVINDFNRGQARADAENEVAIRNIQIQTMQQQVQIEQQKKKIKIIEAQGIAEAQKIINKTLTPQYLQHEAIDAQLEAAKNSSHTETIYVPSGTQGIPNVFDMSGGTHGK